MTTPIGWKIERSGSSRRLPWGMFSSVMLMKILASVRLGVSQYSRRVNGDVATHAKANAYCEDEETGIAARSAQECSKDS